MPHETRKLFTERLGIRRPGSGLIYEDAPEPVRHGFLNLLERVENWLPEWKYVCKALETAVDRWTPRSGYGVVGINHIAHLVDTCEWYHFYDLAEATGKLLSKNAEAVAFFERSSTRCCFATTWGTSFARAGSRK